MEVKLARIDNRLLHGIVASQWAPSVGAMRVMIIDDEVAGNELKKNGMKLAKPAGSALSIISLETALTNYKNGKYIGQTVFLIVKNPQIILELINAGVKIPKLNIGATAEKNNEIKLSGQATVTKEEMKLYREIYDRGTAIEIQYIPADTIVQFKNFLEK
ncbi:PTS sugar transporter subunit IIB [Fusobacterium varium]|jgi:mannose/fructose/N-acetylgalactosamine-specific phosphotransferase system component IIB|uniref:PTS sugar transporter subunit IIB n=1 Tax=Fusobacterium TaxID=848 RepID=UPI001032A6DA|nr:PTS sugar transporter subunit IIB [Fusobacterium ulcerans]